MWWFVSISAVQAVVVYLVATLPNARQASSSMQRSVPAAQGSDLSAPMMIAVVGEGRPSTPNLAVEKAVDDRPSPTMAVVGRSLQPLTSDVHSAVS